MITAECINCTACATDCPVEAISPGPHQFIINPNTCVDCEGLYNTPRCAQVCPVGACVPLRDGYLKKMATMAARGARPVRYGPDAPVGEYVEGGWYEESPFLFVREVGDA
jgi:Na+-translocating ferredoxin:NAD+ oxidoreductase RNF subunit RnfB